MVAGVMRPGDTALPAQGVVAEPVVMQAGRWQRTKDHLVKWWNNRWARYGTLAAVLVIGAVIGLLPVARYNVLGLLLKTPVTVMVVDSKAGGPVSDATVVLAGQQVKTDAEGRAVLRVHAGSKTLAVAKHAYSGYSHAELVTLSASSSHFKATLGALGRPVKVKVVNKVGGRPVAGAVIRANGTDAKTDKTGRATLVIPSDAAKQTANVSLPGYNTAKVTVTATGQLAKNTFKIVPAGKLYFLSNSGGALQVVKSDLDGGHRQAILSGTATKQVSSPSLRMSPDRKYVAVALNRPADAQSELQLVNTANGDRLTTMERGNKTFELEGWSGDRLVYLTTSGDTPVWQPNRQTLKSYDAATGQSLPLDQSQGSGTGTSDLLMQSFGTIYVMGKQVVYVKNWDASTNHQTELASKQAELDMVNVDGSSHQVAKGFSPAVGAVVHSLFLQPVAAGPDSLYLDFNNGINDVYYDYADAKVTVDARLKPATFQAAVTSGTSYFVSPSGKQTFWSQPQATGSAVFTGDQTAANRRQQPALSGYTAISWCGDDYLLLSRSSGLYVASTVGGAPLKVTDSLVSSPSK